MLVSFLPSSPASTGISTNSRNQFRLTFITVRSTSPGFSELEGRKTPLLSQEGWREAPGWFQRGNLEACCFGTTPRGIRFAIPLPS